MNWEPFNKHPTEKGWYVVWMLYPDISGFPAIAHFDPDNIYAQWAGLESRFDYKPTLRARITPPPTEVMERKETMLKLRAWLCRIFHRRSTQGHVDARVLKIDIDIVTEKEIAELVARCQPVVIRYSSYHLRKVNGNIMDIIR